MSALKWNLRFACLGDRFWDRQMWRAWIITLLFFVTFEPQAIGISPKPISDEDLSIEIAKIANQRTAVEQQVKKGQREKDVDELQRLKQEIIKQCRGHDPKERVFEQIARNPRFVGAYEDVAYLQTLPRLLTTNVWVWSADNPASCLFEARLTKAFSIAKPQAVEIQSRSEAGFEWAVRAALRLGTTQYGSILSFAQQTRTCVGKRIARAVSSEKNVPDTDRRWANVIAGRKYAVGDRVKLQFLDARRGKVDLSSLRGRVVLLNFWDPNCGGWKAELPILQESYNAYHAKGLEIIGVAVHRIEPDQIDNPVQQVIPWPSYNKGSTRLLKSFGVFAPPQIWLIDKKGVLRDTGAAFGESFLEEKIQLLLAESAE
jgi:thiol-disulfide isomerase/thioredoxin